MTQVAGKTATRTLSTILGHRITVFANDYIGKKIARTGLYEREPLEFLLQLLQNIDDAVVLDVGANIGNHALAFSTRAGQVHAFEPLPEAWSLLEQNIRQNSIGNINAHPFALSDETGTSTLYRNRSGNVGGSSFDEQGAAAEAVTVHKKTGDQVVEELGLHRIDLVKIDVEGHELYVLNGLMRALEKFHPCIVMEWTDPVSIDRLRGSDVMRFLQNEYNIDVLGTKHERGYWHGRRFAWVRRKLTRLFRRPFPLLYEFDPTRIYKNLLLVPKGKEHLLPKQDFLGRLRNPI
jgi:FkbM family methyltransferase